MIRQNQSGFTLIEIVVVIVVIGILSTVATRTFMQTTETAQYEATYAEMEALSKAMVGNPDLFSDGVRSDFGYVGDVGSMPPNLDALVSNPGGYGTWDGPYIIGDFSNLDFKSDAWGSPYLMIDSLLRSTGSGVNIDKLIAGRTSQLLANAIRGVILDASGNRPGNVFNDSLVLMLSYPDGAGSMASSAVNPTGNGRFAFSGIPIGNHLLTAIYVPDGDTIIYPITILPGRDMNLEIAFPTDLW